jgi:hypothetical protein
MKLVHALRWRHLMIAIVLSCAAIAGVSIWRAKATPKTPLPSPLPEQKLSVNERLRRGLGSEVHFANKTDSDDKVASSVESVASFIHGRSGLAMSDDTKKLLKQAEKDTLKGKRAPITLDALADSLSKSAADRIKNLTDPQIEHAVNTFRPDLTGQVTARASGKWGFMTKEEMVNEVKGLRAQGADSGLENMIRPVIAEEIRGRAAFLSEGMPEQFGRIKDEGVTPTQAVVIAYSIAADDPLTDSRSDLAQQVVQQRTDRALTRAKAKEQKLNSPVPFGSKGFFHSAPVNLLLNKPTIDQLLKEGGKNK